MLSSDENVASRATSLLESLPADIETLYERILAKIPKAHQAEAALLVHIANEHEAALNGEPCPIGVLLQACNFVQVKYANAKRFPIEMSVRSREARLKGLLGDLVEIYNVEYVFPLDELRMRLTHKSLKTYLERSQWIQRHIAKSTSQAYAKLIWTRLPVEVIEQAILESAMPRAALEPKLVADLLASNHMPIDGQQLTDRAIVLPPWKPWKAFLYYCSQESFSLTNLDPYNGFPVAESTFVLLHLDVCVTCTCSARWKYQKAQPKALWEHGCLHLLLDISHGRWLSVENFLKEHANKTNANIMRLLYDLTVRIMIARYSVVLPLDCSALLKTWVSYGYHLEGRHLCMCVDMLSEHYTTVTVDPGLKSLLAATKTDEKQSTEHDEYCNLRGTGKSLACHWLQSRRRYKGVADLNFMIAFGVDMEASLTSEGSIFHIILRHARLETRHEVEVFWVESSFVTAARLGIRLDVANCKHTALVYARKLRTKAQLRSLWKESEGFQAYRQFLDQAIMTLEEYERDHEWGPGLDALGLGMRK